MLQTDLGEFESGFFLHLQLFLSFRKPRLGFIALWGLEEKMRKMMCVRRDKDEESGGNDENKGGVEEETREGFNTVLCYTTF